METSQNDLPESLTRLDVRLVLSRIPIVAYSTTATLDDVLHVQEALRNLALEHHEAEPATYPFHLGDLYTERGQTLQGSFSAVSKQHFASKYAFV